MTVNGEVMKSVLDKNPIGVNNMPAGPYVIRVTFYNGQVSHTKVMIMH